MDTYKDTYMKHIVHIKALLNYSIKALTSHAYTSLEGIDIIHR